MSQQIAARLAPARWTLTAVTVVLVGAAIILASTDVWGYGDSYCGRLFSPSGEDCSPFMPHRLHLVVATVATAGVAGTFTTAAWAARRRGIASPSGVAAGCLVLAVVAGLFAVWLIAGGDGGDCGSVLSHVDPDGRYAPDKPAICAPVYRHTQVEAAVFGSLGLIGLLAATSSRLPRRPAG